MSHAIASSTPQRWSQWLPTLPLYAVLGPTLLLGCVLGAFATTNELTSLVTFYRYPMSWLTGVLMTLASIAGVWVALRVPHDQLRRSCAIVLVVGVALHAAYALSTGETWRSDFAAMWHSATIIAATGLPEPAGIYDMRAMPVLVPLVWLFGPHQALVPALNVIIVGAIQTIGMVHLYRAHNPRAALVFGVVFCLVPETFHASLITSHDILGLFFLVVAFCAAAAFRRRMDVVGSGLRGTLAAVAALFCFAISVALMEMQRQIGVVMVAALALHLVGLCIARVLRRRDGALVARSGGLPAIVVLLLATVLSLFALRSINDAIGLSGVASENQARAHRVLAGNMPSLSTGYYSWLRDFDLAYLQRIDEPAAAKGEFVEDLILSDFANQPIARLKNHVFRLYRQFNLGSNYRFYLYDMQREDPVRYWSQRIWNISFTAVFCVALLVATLLSAGRRDRFGSLHLQLCALAALLLLVDIAGESQPRYVFPIWFIGAHLIARRLTDAPVGTLAATLRSSARTLGAGAALVLAGLVVGWFILDRSYSPAQGRVLDRWAFAAKGTHNTRDTAAALVRWQRGSGRAARARTAHTPQLQVLDGFGSHALVLGFASKTNEGGIVDAISRRACSPTEADLAFFIVGEAQKGGLVTAMLDVYVNERRVAEIAVPGERETRYHRVADALPAGGCGQVRFALRAERRVSSSYALRVARTEIHFARLVPSADSATAADTR